jgi:hypothetical protein
VDSNKLIISARSVNMVYTIPKVWNGLLSDFFARHKITERASILSCTLVGWCVPDLDYMGIFHIFSLILSSQCVLLCALVHSILSMSQN